jgi:isocitrate dehydrogenase
MRVSSPERFTAAEKQIGAEMIAVQDKPADIGAYYQPDDAMASAALRPSKTLNDILDAV